MCSIAGLHSPRIHDQEFLRAQLSGWHALLRHRGPDDWGWFLSATHDLLLFNTRLAITGIDNGRQPLTNERGTIWLACNGEIYDHREWRKDLEKNGHRFRTDSDAEVIIHLYEERGIGAVSSLAGEFAFALYDAGKGQLFLVRDRFGVKPLYYARTSDGFSFGSEIKALFADPAFPRRFDEQALQNHLQTFFLDTETVFQDICQVPPGHYLRYDLQSGKVQLHAYWQAPLGAPPSRATEEEQIEQFQFLLQKAVRRRIPAEVPFGVYLSGGLDSAAIATTLAQLRPSPFPVFSIGFGRAPYDELPHARKLARELGLPQHIVRLGAGDLKEAFLQSIWHSEMPVLNPHGAAKQLLARAAREHVKVVLTGEGADELLWGYALFAHLQEREDAQRGGGAGKLSMSAGRLSGKLRHYDKVVGSLGVYPYSLQRHFYLRSILPLLLAGRYRRAAIAWRWQPALSQHLDPGRFRGLSSAEATQLLLLRSDFPSYLLNYLGDRQEMASGLEGRTPFLDHELAEFACTLPPDLKLRGGAGKYILRAALRGCLDEQLRMRPKQAFYAPALESIGFFSDPDFFRPFAGREAFRETGVFRPSFFAALTGISRLLPQNNPLLPVVESIAVFVLSLHMVHELFVRNFPEWKRRFAPMPLNLNVHDHQTGGVERPG